MKSKRVVLITGAAGGMGAAFVARFLDNDDIVIAADTSDDALASLHQSIGGSDRLLTHVVDISEEASVASLATFVKETHGRVDVLINCAGWFPTQSFDDMTLSDWNKVIGINLTGVFLMVKAMLPFMKGRGWGRIVNIGSGSVFEGVASQIHYVSAKAGVIGFTRSIARSLGSEGITVNLIAPGLTVTPNVRKHMPPEMLEAQIAGRAIPRDEVAQDLVGATFFLASPDADFMSGQTLNVDGGKNMT